MSAMDSWTEQNLSSSLKLEAEWVQRSWENWKSDMRTKQREDIEMRSRSLMEKLGDVVMGTLMIVDASSDGDDVAVEAVRAWVEEKDHAAALSAHRLTWRHLAERDKKFVFGTTALGQERAML